MGPENPLQLSWGNNGGGGGGPSTTPYGRQPAAQTEGLLQPLGFDAPLQIGWYGSHSLLLLLRLLPLILVLLLALLLPFRRYPVANVDQLNPGELSQNVNGGFVGGWMG